MGFDAVALVSGGKDSVMAAMMAQSYGHNIVALANLLPADGDVEELDSHCFQTVGHRAVGVYHELTGLPLFRRKIVGTSAHVEMSYDVCDERVKGDEVEDLRALLAAVVRELPNVRAVTSGAILSDYQRLRVEAVCADLGLTSLAYLWRQPQGLMLETICASDVDAVLCKVAAMGLKPDRDLGRSLVDAKGTLYEIESAYGSHCCGEGGEFETLTMDCPLFRRGSLRFEDTRVVVTSRDPFAPSAHLAVEAVAVDVKDHTVEPGRLVDVNADVDPPAVTRRRRTIDAFEEVLTSEDAVIGGNARLTRSWRRAGPKFWTVAAAVPVSGPNLAAGSAEEAARSAEAGLHFVELSLRENGRDWSDVALVQLFVRDMSHFAAVNEAYLRVVPSTQPPARACVQPLARRYPRRHGRARGRGLGRVGQEISSRAERVVLGAGVHRTVRSGGDAPRPDPHGGGHRYGPGDVGHDSIQATATRTRRRRAGRGGAPRPWLGPRAPRSLRTACRAPCTLQPRAETGGGRVGRGLRRSHARRGLAG